LDEFQASERFPYHKTVVNVFILQQHIYKFIKKFRLRRVKNVCSPLLHPTETGLEKVYLFVDINNPYLKKMVKLAS